MKPDAKTETKPDVNPDVKPDVKPDTKPDTKPAVKANMNLKLEFNMQTAKALLAVLRKAQVLIYGLLLVGVFGYSAYSINAALNVAPAATQSTIKPLPAVTFDKTAIDSLRNRENVDSSVPVDPGDHSLF